MEKIKEVVKTEEEIREGNALLEEADEIIDSFNLNWTFRSIEWLVNRKNITLNQLRSCVFKGKDKEVVHDLERAVKYILMAGMVTRDTKDEDMSRLEEKAYDMMERWIEEFGFIGTLQILLINRMEKKHFFMGTRDVKLLDHLAYKNLQKSMVMSQVSVDMQTKLNQSRAMQ